MIQPRNIHAIGRNYAAHASELNNPIPDHPVVFAKSPACLTRADRVCFPADLGAVHHEVELVLQIAADLAPGQARGMEDVSGIAVGIDFTARERQTALKAKGLPWHLAKNFRDSCWLGPLREGLERLPTRFELYRNGEPAQQGDSNHMIFNVTRMLRAINRAIPLERGDLIYTGTPRGVGPAAHGDELRVICLELETDETIVVTEAPI